MKIERLYKAEKYGFTRFRINGGCFIVNEKGFRLAYSLDNCLPGKLVKINVNDLTFDFIENSKSISQYFYQN